jgi:hypothetical protein
MEQQKRKTISDLVYVAETDHPNMTLTYLDFSYSTPSKNEEPVQMGLKAITKFIELETYQASSSMGREQLQDIRALHGIDAQEMLNSVLTNEMEQTLSKKITSTLYELGEKSMLAERTKFQRWANKWFGYEPKEYLGVIDTPDFIRLLTAKILKKSNLIAVRCRRGPANFILTGPQIGAMLMDSHIFQMEPLNAGNGLYNTNAQPYYTGSFGGMDVYVDPYMKWNDKRILLGRKTNDPSQPGVIYAKGKDVNTAMIIDENSMAPKTILRWKAAVVAYGSAEKAFHMIQISEKEHNLFTHILDRIKIKFKQLKKSK